MGFDYEVDVVRLGIIINSAIFALNVQLQRQTSIKAYNDIFFVLYSLSLVSIHNNGK